MVNLKYGMRISIPDKGIYTISEYREDDMDANFSKRVRCIPDNPSLFQESYFTDDLKIFIDKGYIQII